MDDHDRQNDIYVWIDLEMTGLDESSDKIMEVAVIITDPQLNIINEGFSYPIKLNPKDLEGMDPVVTEMHTQTGLINKVLTSEAKELSEVEQELYELIKRMKRNDQSRALPAGNSVHVDMKFIRKYMPRVNEQLFYRIIDVSSFKEVIHAHRSDIEKTIKSKDLHTARADIMYSLEELKKYLQILGLIK